MNDILGICVYILVVLTEQWPGNNATTNWNPVLKLKYLYILNQVIMKTSLRFLLVGFYTWNKENLPIIKTELPQVSLITNSL